MTRTSGERSGRYVEVTSEATSGVHELCHGWVHEDLPELVTLAVLFANLNVEGLCSVDRVGDVKVVLYLHRDDLPVLREVIDAMICEAMEEPHE